MHGLKNNIIAGNGISDYRQTTINLILAKYLISVKKYSYKQSYDTIIDWLNRCAVKRQLEFDATHLVNKALNDAQYGHYKYPMKLETMRLTRPEMYNEIMNN